MSSKKKTRAINHEHGQLLLTNLLCSNKRTLDFKISFITVICWTLHVTKEKVFFFCNVSTVLYTNRATQVKVFD